MYYTEHKPKNKNRGGQGSVVRDDSGNFKEIEREGEEKCLHIYLY